MFAVSWAYNYFTANLPFWQDYFVLRENIAGRIGIRGSGDWGVELPYYWRVQRTFYLQVCT